MTPTPLETAVHQPMKRHADVEPDSMEALAIDKMVQHISEAMRFIERRQYHLAHDAAERVKFWASEAASDLYGPGFLEILRQSDEAK